VRAEVDAFKTAPNPVAAIKPQNASPTERPSPNCIPFTRPSPIDTVAAAKVAGPGEAATTKNAEETANNPTISTIGSPSNRSIFPNAKFKSLASKRKIDP